MTVPGGADDPASTPPSAGRCAVVILAAGQGTRMKSRLSKLLHTVAGRPMIDAVLDAAAGAAPAQTLVVVGHHADELRAHLARRPEPIVAVLQEEQLGTGHAVAVAMPALDPDVDEVLALYADQPLYTPEVVADAVAAHRASGGAVTMASCVHPDGGQHGRVTRDPAGRIIKITEARDAVGEPPGPKEINSGIHCFRRDWLAAHLPRLPRHDNGEYYLTDLIALAASEGQDGAPWPVAAVAVDLDVAMGVNNRVQLAEAERLARRRINERLMLAGVTLVDPATTYIDEGVAVGADTVIGPGTVLAGRTAVGEDCRIGPGAHLRDSTVGRGCTIRYAMLEEAVVEDGSDVGPYARLRPGAHLGPHVHVGNFAEIKNARVGAGTMMGHFSYLGDATVGERVNYSAGAITANYDGREKHQTVIGDGAFIGCDTILRAPVTIGPGASTGAGAVVTHDVPPGVRVVGVPARPVPRQAAPGGRGTGGTGVAERNGEESGGA